MFNFLADDGYEARNVLIKDVFYFCFCSPLYTETTQDSCKCSWLYIYIYIYIYMGMEMLGDLPTLSFRGHKKPVPSQMFLYFILLQLAVNSNHDWATHTENVFGMISYQFVILLARVGFHTRIRTRCATTPMIYHYTTAVGSE